MPRPAPVLIGLLLALVATAGAQPTSPEARLVAWERHQEMNRTSPFGALTWRAIGPLQAGARVEAIAVPAGSPSTIYAGIGSGNLWKTTNNGITWTPIFDKESSFTIGDVAVSASNPDVVWVGTGETQPRPWGYSYAGTGVFKSTDAGATWQHMGLADTHHIGKVLIDPVNPDVVWVAAIGHFWTENEERGVFRTADGGQTWSHVLYLGDDTGAVDLVMDPRNPEVVFAAMWQRSNQAGTVAGSRSGIYKTRDGGTNWERLHGGLPDGPVGRMGLDISPSNPDVIYAFLDNHAPIQDSGVVGGELYRSADGGDTWVRTHEEDLSYVFGTSGWKFADVRIVPDDENALFILGTQAYRSLDGGATFSRTGEQIARVHDTRGEVMHLDHHEIWIDPTNPNRVLLGNDGGLFQSYDGGDSWLHHNNIPAAEFYSISVDNAFPYNVYGGTQDNAALYGPSDTRLDGSTVEGSLTDPWENVYLDRWTGGDSFDTLLDPTTEGVVYYEHQHGSMVRKDIPGESVLSGGRSSTGIAPRAPQGEEAWTFGWYTPLVISHHDPRTLYAGANKLLRSTNRGDDWVAISPDLADPGEGERGVVPYGTITFVAESPFRPDRIWVGTEGGTIWRTDNGGADWTRLDSGLPEKWVSRVAASSHDFDTVYIAMSGFRQDDFASYVFRSTDGGSTWDSISEGLPAATVNVITEDPSDSSILYVGTDLGAYVSLDAGLHWMSLSSTLPTTPVHDLEVHARDAEIVIGTHGRSAFVLDAEPIRHWASVEVSAEPRLLDVKPAILPGVQGRRVLSRPGTTYGVAVFTYATPRTLAGSAVLRIRDPEGDLIAQLTGAAEAGFHTLRWNLMVDGGVVEPGQYVDRMPYAPPGVYSVVLQLGGARLETHLTLLGQ